jgi:hypothetical protein
VIPLRLRRDVIVDPDFSLFLSNESWVNLYSSLLHPAWNPPTWKGRHTPHFHFLSVCVVIEDKSKWNVCVWAFDIISLFSSLFRR